MILYHGSATPGIDTLKPLSKLHSDGSPVLYLTGNIPYALFYIWDASRTGSNYKFITCGIRDGIVTYEEQFPEQMQTLYQGAKGYLYVTQTGHAEPILDRESMYFSREQLPISESIFIPDVYEAIMSYVNQGSVQIIPYQEMPDERKALFREHYQKFFAELSSGSNYEQQRFFSRYFPNLWPKRKTP